MSTYTHAPKPRPGLLAGSAQLFAWLFFHPTAWRSHVRRLAPELAPGFALAELPLSRWRDPAIRQLGMQSMFIWLAGVAVVVGLISWLAGAPANAIAFGAAFGASLGLVLGGLLSLAVSWLLGIVTGWVGGVSMGLGASIWASAANGMAPHFVLGPGWGVIFGLISAASAYALLYLPRRRESLPSWLRQTGRILFSAALSVIVVIALFILVAVVVAREQQQGLSVSFGRYPYLSSTLAIAAAMTIIFTVVITWRTNRWRLGVALGCLVGVIYGLILVFVLHSATIDYILVEWPLGLGVWEITGGAAFFVHIGVIMVALYAGLFALAFALLDRLAGRWAGAAAGVIAAAGVHLALRSLITLYDFWPNLVTSLLIIGLGASLAVWRPWLTWPFQRIWDYLLYQFDLERPPAEPLLLHRCTPFWDEQQRLRMSGLCAHLVLAYQQRPQETEAAFAYLMESPQRWVVACARIELTARRLEACASIDDLRNLQLRESDLDAPTSPILHRFARFSRDIDASLRQVTRYHRRLALEGVVAQWEQFTHDLALSREEHASRFYPAARRWLDIAETHLETLMTELEESGEIDNPYIFGAPISEEQAIFVGRQDIIARIEQHLLDARRPPLLLYGQRRMGKTSLLRNLGRMFVSEIAPMFVDGQGVSLASDYVDFLYGTVRQMARSAKRYRALQLPLLDRRTLVSSPFSALDEWLDDVETLMDVTGHRVALIAFDEMETLQQGMARGRYDEMDVLSFFRHIIQHRPRFRVLLTSSHMLLEFPSYWASYLINMQTIKIGYLDELSARQLIERPTPRFALHYEPAAVEHILALTRGHPHLIQLLCHELVIVKNRQPLSQRRMATVADVEEAAARALDVGRLFFEDIERNQVGGNGRIILRFMAAQGKNAVIERGRLAALVGDALDETLAQLQLRDLIEQDGTGYRFQVELIRRWFDSS
ncbi:MAG: ATP-binding protein [Chloroflexi bacterium]|nr:ATP-binding protein [Chloroflexota bacterium]